MFASMADGGPGAASALDRRMSTNCTCVTNQREEPTTILGAISA